MSYKYKKVPNGKTVTWIKLIKEYDGLGYTFFPKDLKVGDITWVINFDHHHTHLEENRYGGNFDPKYFELVISEPTYEIY
jgi:hypothetical protein